MKIFALVSVLALSWRSLAGLDLPRAGYAAGVLEGKYVLAGGSYWAGGEKKRTTAVDLYDPQSDRWTRGPEMPVPLSDSASATVGDSLYVLGGTDDGVKARSAVLRLRNGKWSEVPELRLPAGRVHAAAATDNARIILFGGVSTPHDFATATDSVMMCDTKHPAMGWTELPRCPAGPHLVAAAVVLEGGAYLIGGCRPSGSSVENLDSVWRLDLATRHWAREAQLPEPRRIMWAAAADGRVLIFGGYTDQFRRDVLAYDPHARAFSTLGELPEEVADAKFFRIGKSWIVAGGEVGMKIRGTHTWEVTLP